MKEPSAVSTATIAIRPYRIEDASALHEAAIESAAEVQPFMPWCHAALTVQQARTWIEVQIRAFESCDAFEFAVVGADSRFLGSCGVNQIDLIRHRGNLAYWVRTSATGRGVATAAIQQVVGWIFQNTELGKLEAVISTDNVASIRAAEKAGGIREGILRGRLWLHGTAHDAAIFSFVKSGEKTT